MKQFQFLLLTAFLFFASCKKGDVICIGCPKPPACLPTEFLQRVELGHPSPISIFRLTNVNGLPASITSSFRPSQGTPAQEPMKIVYVGDRLYLLRPFTLDTVLSAKLDKCKRPLTSTYYKNVGDLPLFSRYSYNFKGELTKIVISGSRQDVYSFKYDNRGNVTSISRDNDHYRNVYTYDYSRPFTKGVRYAGFGNIDMEPHFYFEWLGQLNFSRANLRSSQEYWEFGIKQRSLLLQNYGFSNGNVNSYIGYTNGDLSQRTFYNISWDCGEGTVAK